MTDEETIRRNIESRVDQVVIEVQWSTPAGNQRSTPIYETTLNNAYLAKQRTLKAKTHDELALKAQDCLSKWREQEIRRRIGAAKKGAKEQGKAEAARLDSDAAETLKDMASILRATLSVDDRIDWDAERNTRLPPEFTFDPPPTEPDPGSWVLPDKPSLTWLFWWRQRHWQTQCAEAMEEHRQHEARMQLDWQERTRAHVAAKARAKDAHAAIVANFCAEQVTFNQAVERFRRRFESGEPAAIEEYCAAVFDSSDYPEAIQVLHSVEFDVEASYVVVNVDLPSLDEIPAASGYKFVARGNKTAPIPLKKKELASLHTSTLDQIVVRTMHEVFEACYTVHVKGAIVVGWTTSVDKATGQSQRKQVRCIASDRGTFESFDLSRVEAAACVARLSENAGYMGEAS